MAVLKEKHKKSLDELLKSRVFPKSPLSYNELKALYVKEPGLYSQIFRSTKKQAQELHDWVNEDASTAIRRHGSYRGDHASSLRLWFDEDLKVALEKREDEWQLAQRQLDEVDYKIYEQLAMGGHDEALQVVLRQRDDALALSISGVSVAEKTGFDGRLEEALGRRDERNSTRFGEKVSELLQPLVSLVQSLIFAMTTGFDERLVRLEEALCRALEVHNWLSLS